MKILLIKLSAIGDVVQTLPALEAIKKEYPESEITWLVEEAAADILQGHPLIRRVVVSRRKRWIRMMKNPSTFIEGLAGSARFLRDLRQERYDMAIDFQGLLKSGVLIGIARAKRKIGFKGTRELSSLFLNERLPAYNIEKHALERYLDVARYIGVTDPASSCTLPIQQEIFLMHQRVAGIKTENRPLIVINPMARWKTKLWPEQNFAELADRLVKEKKAAVIFTGSRDDRVVIERIRSLMREEALNWTGETSLRELGALAALCDVFITTDTGPMHLAAAAGARVLALFGPTAPWRTGPYSSSSIVLRTGIACSPCFKRECDRSVQCMKQISAAEVMNALK